MIDIIRDYTAIGLGTAQATRTRVAEAGQAGAVRTVAWIRPDVADPERGFLASVALAPWALAMRVQDDLDAAVTRIGLVSAAEVQALRQQVQWIERRLAEMREDL